MLRIRAEAGLLLGADRGMAAEAEKCELLAERRDARRRNGRVGEQRGGGDWWQRDHRVRLLVDALAARQMGEPAKKRPLARLAGFLDRLEQLQNRRLALVGRLRLVEQIARRFERRDTHDDVRVSRLVRLDARRLQLRASEEGQHVQIANLPS